MTYVTRANRGESELYYLIDSCLCGNAFHDPRHLLQHDEGLPALVQRCITLRCHCLVRVRAQ